MALTFFRSFSIRGGRSKRAEANKPIIVHAAAAVNVPIEELRELPVGATTTDPEAPVTAAPIIEIASPIPAPASAPTALPSRNKSTLGRSGSLFRRLHTRGTSSESTETNATNRSSGVSTFAMTVHTSATSLSRSVSVSARNAKRKSREFMVTPLHEGRPVENDGWSHDDEESSCAYDIIF